ncbi:MAG TPA: hypothetical protein VKR53_13570 [Puia sp.]|nr:hypothetical protein [Puia sp.]
MKKYLMTFLFAVMISFGFTQAGHHPPRTVSESFQKEYPHSTPSRWTHSANGWSVEFEDKDFDNGEVTARFDSRGRHLETQIPYDEKDVPATVKDNLHKRYQGSDNYEYTRIERPGDKPLYQARFKHDKKMKTTYVDQQGEQHSYR